MLMTCMPFCFVKYKRHCLIVSLVHAGYRAIKVHIQCQSDSCIRRTCKSYEEELTGPGPWLCLFIDVGKWLRGQPIYMVQGEGCGVGVPAGGAGVAWWGEGGWGGGVWVWGSQHCP